MHVSINIVSWNDRRYLPELFAAIRSQTHTDYTVRILDNGNPDGEALQYIMQNEPHWLAVRNTKNVGYAAGHNQLMRIALERYTGDSADHAVLIANSDMDWNPTMLAELVKALEEHPEIDAVQPKIFRAYSESGDAEGNAVKSDILDSTGMRIRSGWRFDERGAGEMDKGQYDTRANIVAPSGALMLLRISAVKDVMINDEVFDANFVMAGEHWDFGWRLLLAGHQSLLVPLARAHHYRGMLSTERQSWWKFARRAKRAYSPMHAYAVRNLWLSILKNCSFGEMIRSAPSTMWYLGFRTMQGALFSSEQRRLYVRSIIVLPSMLRKRRTIQRNIRISAANLRKSIYESRG